MSSRPERAVSLDCEHIVADDAPPVQALDVRYGHLRMTMRVCIECAQAASLRFEAYTVREAQP